MVPTNNKLLYYLNKWVNLTAQEEEMILSYFEPCAVKKKKDLLEVGDICEYIYFITQGCLRSYFVDDKGNEHI